MPPRQWVSLVPYGVGQVKPNHYLEIARTVWENRDQLPFAWRILSRGVCDGCALGTTGLRDFTMDGVHLCTVRLNLLRMNTMPALDARRLTDVSRLRALSSSELRRLGRLPYPMLRARGDPGFRRISWEEAYTRIAQRIRATQPERLAFYLTSRGITNEVYYVAQKLARFLGSNNVDNSARVCHAPSTVAMKQVLGVSSSTCSYKDWIGTDCLLFIGSDVPNNQPVTTKYIYYAKRRGTKILVINPLREPGLERYWVPSVLESALFGTRVADEFFPIHTGGDIPFLNGVLKHILERGLEDRAFLESHTEGLPELRSRLEGQSWQELQAASGASRESMQRLGELLGRARSAVFVWSMGVTQHAFGVQNVKAILNLALARGFVGREHCGLMPIRGHSGVQGGAEVGCVPNLFPGSRPVNAQTAAEMAELWGFPVPAEPGLTAVEQIWAAARGEIDVFYAAGGNFLETLPEPDSVRQALERVPLRVHQDLVLTSQMLLEPAGEAILLPAATRYEQRDGGTETSTERYIYFSPEIPGRRVGEARSEWEIYMELGERVRPQEARLIHFPDGRALREEIARTVPFYAGVEGLSRAGDAVQWGGRLLCRDGHFPKPSGRAVLTPLELPEASIPEGRFALSTRRGKQFNSMIHQQRDPLTGARRDEVLMSEADARALGLRAGDPVLIRSSVGEMRARVRIAPIRPRNLQVHWPEGNVLLRRGVTDPISGIPDYNAVVELVPLDGARREGLE